ncbi:MAG TPA: alpha/beta fold hydrolase [Pseudonocardiaceae bacterium]
MRSWFALARDHRPAARTPPGDRPGPPRGCGASTRAPGGYDAGTLAADIDGILDALGEATAAVVAIDAGAAVAFLLALTRPGRVRRLVVMESTRSFRGFAARRPAGMPCGRR